MNGTFIVGVEGVSYKQVHTEIFLLTIKKPNNCCIDNDGSILLIENITQSDNEIFLVCRKFLNVNDLFECPLPSGNIGIFLCYNLSELEPIKLINIKSKALIIPMYNDENVDTFSVLTILH